MSELNPYSKKMNKENVEAITNPDIDENLKDVVPDTPKNPVKPKIAVPNTRIPNRDQNAAMNIEKEGVPTVHRELTPADTLAATLVEYFNSIPYVRASM